ncbi:MAG TPA: tetratricopeptide repeat protein, partial [Planctomycetota bacterium]|nr:tetratricopeptide repeat protein [Planctomycetota bacterium]
QSAWPRAIALARRAETDAVHGDEAYAIEALAFRSAGDRDGARAAFLKLRERRPSAPLGYVGALCDLGADPLESATVLKKACDVLGPAPFGLDLAVALDLASRSAGSADDEPVKLAHAALQRAANDETATFVEAAALLRRGRGDEAGATLAAAGVAPELRGALATLDRETLGRLELLLALRRHRFDQEAATVARALLEKDSKNLVLAIFGARALAASGDVARAKEVLGAAVAAAPRSIPCRLELGLLLGSAKETRAEALSLFEQGTGLVSESPQLALGRAMALEELGRADEAIAAYRQVIAIDPRNGIARNNLAWLLVQKGTPDAVAEALAISRAVVAEMPNLPAALDTLSRVLIAKGELGPALEDAQKAARLAPLDAGIRLTFARALDALGRKQDAANQYEVSLLLSSSFEGRAEAEKRLAELRPGSR